MSRFHIDPDERVEIFEFDPSDVVSENPPNVIVIRARMTVEIAGRVRSELSKRNAANQTEGTSGESIVALLLHNILGWRGPDFDDLPCTPENIRALPPVELDPFIEQVVNAIGERNAKRPSPNVPSPATSGTSANAGAADLTRSTDPRPDLLPVNGTSKLLSHVVSAGHRDRSGT